MASTRKTYQVAERRYITFCNSFALMPLPTSEAILCYYVACLGQQGLAHTSIRTYLSGVRQLQIAHGLEDPKIDQMSRLRQILKGVKVERGKEGKASLPRMPITPTILRKKSDLAQWKHLIQLSNALGSSLSNILLFLQIRRGNCGR